MRIGINASFLGKPMTGIGQVTREFLKHLATHPEFPKHEWYLYTDGELDQELKKNIPENAWRWRAVKTWWSRQDIPHQYFFESSALPRAIQQDEVEVFFSLYQSATVLPKHIHHVMLVHDLIPKLFPEYLTKWTSRFHYKEVEKGIMNTTAILTPSETTKEDVINLLQFPQERIVTLPLGVDERFFDHLDEASLQEALKAYDLLPGYFYHGGGLEIRKNTEAVLRAYGELVKEDSSLPPLVISGKVYEETNPLATPVKRLIAELGLEEKVKLLGLVPEKDLPILYQGACMFLFPSRYEGFGLPVIEAFASGTPVIMSQAGSLKELSTKGEALLIEDLVHGKDELKRLMKELLANETLQATLKEKGILKAKEYRWETFSEKAIQALVQ